MILDSRNKPGRKVDDPTPEQIKRQCDEIQLGWTKRDRRLRGEVEYHVEFPEITASDMGVAYINLSPIW
jgi:hypothetical protein